MAEGVLIRLFRHDQAVVIAGLVLVIAIAWGYLLLGAGLEMPAMAAMAGRMMMAAPAWTPAYAALQLLMWAAMMAAMMLPSAAPVILSSPRLPAKGGQRRARPPSPSAI
jgi:predicted metal-binding membrane protein